jgi:hypothetical protein
MDAKKPPEGPVVKRDEHNMVDHDSADKALQDLHKKLITEERAHQKEISFKNARGNKRDIVVKIIIFQRNSVDGKIVLGDEKDGFESAGDPRDPYKYKYFEHIDAEIDSRHNPLSPKDVTRWQMGIYKCMTNYLAKMGVINLQ